MQSQKWQSYFSSFTRQIIEYHSNPSLCSNHWCKEAEVEWFHEELQPLLWWTTKKDVLFILGGWNTKVGSQDIVIKTGKFGFGVKNEAEQRWTEFCQENTLVIANGLFQQPKGWFYTWMSPEGQYWNQADYVLCSHRWRSSIESAKTRSGADYGSDHEVHIAKFRLKLKKVRKTSRPFRYDLNQTSYDSTVEVKHRFKGLDLVDRVSEELRTQLNNTVQEAGIKIIPEKKKFKMEMWLSEETL